MIKNKKAYTLILLAIILLVFPTLVHSKSNELSYNASNDFYIKGKIKPKFLYVISEEDMTKEEGTMIATLQGLIATKTDKQIYIITRNEPSYRVWLEDLEENYRVKYKVINDPWELLSLYKPLVKGYILYHKDNRYSVNNACSVASLKESIVIEKSLVSKFEKDYDIDLIKDCSDTDKFWAFNNLWNSGLNHRTVIELNPDKNIALRDYAIISKSLMFYEEDSKDVTFRGMIFKAMEDNARCLGWGPDEHKNVQLASKYGVDTIAADWSYNLSVLSSFKTKVYDNNDKTDKTDVASLPDAHYVTFIVSDGDNQQWFLGSNYTSDKWFGSKRRGEFNLGWSISPSLYYLAPTVYNKYCKDASKGDFKDDFIIAPSGNGYIYPSYYPKGKLLDYTNRINDYAKKVNQRYVLILDDESFYNKSLWGKYTGQENIEGLIYLNYDINNKYGDKILWVNDKPVVSCRDLLWGGIEDDDQLIKNIEDRIKAGYTKKTNPLSYTLVYVHAWSNSIDNIAKVVNHFKDNPKVKVVTPNVFMDMIKNIK